MTLCTSIGLRRSLKTIVHFPTIMLTPIFSFWVIGPKGPYSFKTWCCGGSKEIEVSFLHSWMNFFLTIFGHLIYILVRENPFIAKYGTMSRRIEYFSRWYLPFYLLSMVMMLLIQFWDRFCKCGGDILQKSSLSVKNPLEDILKKSSMNMENPFEESRIECEQSVEGETKV